MTNISVIENKISSVRKYLSILERYKPYSREQITEDFDKKGAVERYLYLAIQSALDLSEAVIAHRNLRKPATLSESFYILNENNIIPSGLTEKLVKMTGFRNVISHDYDNLNYDIVFDVLHNKLKDLETFLEFISSHI